LLKSLNASAIALGISFAAVFANGALAQSRAPEGCILDNCRDREPAAGADRVRRPGPKVDATDDDAPAEPPRPPDNRAFRRGGAAASGNFDFYVLSLSWSSGFCATGGAEKARNQCDLGANLGFVVHGLWPQFERGFPSDCDPSSRAPTRTALESTRGVYPDEGLARYEWRKHGTCTGKSAADYFADAKFARDKVVIPEEFKKLKADEQVAPADIMRSFQEANPRLRPGMMAVGCLKGQLQEVRFCMSKDLRDFRACPEVARGSCRSRQITISAPR
jgi:ribonuclease T2